jgi:hypothetical protein
MRDQKQYWFPAKKYGWGWGLPSVWQGWVTLAVFYILVVIGAFTVLPSYGSIAFVAYCLILCVVLVVVCWLKGEPPRWRWGEK